MTVKITDSANGVCICKFITIVESNINCDDYHFILLIILRK